MVVLRRVKMYLGSIMLIKTLSTIYLGIGGRERMDGGGQLWMTLRTPSFLSNFYILSIFCMLITILILFFVILLLIHIFIVLSLVFIVIILFVTVVIVIVGGVV